MSAKDRPVRLLTPPEGAEPADDDQDVDLEAVVSQAVAAFQVGQGRLDAEEAANSVVPESTDWLLKQANDEPDVMVWPVLCAVPDATSAIRTAIVGEVSRRVVAATETEAEPVKRRGRRRLRSGGRRDAD